MQRFIPLYLCPSKFYFSTDKLGGAQDFWPQGVWEWMERSKTRRGNFPGNLLRQAFLQGVRVYTWALDPSPHPALPLTFSRTHSHHTHTQIMHTEPHSRSHKCTYTNIHRHTCIRTHTHVHTLTHTHDAKEKACLIFTGRGDGQAGAFCLSWNQLGLANSPLLEWPWRWEPACWKKGRRISLRSANGVDGRETGGQVATVSVCARELDGCAWQGPGRGSASLEVFVDHFHFGKQCS